jgi:hypothetical protein
MRSETKFPQLLARLDGVYRSLAPLLNFFMPTMKLESKVKVGSKEIKKHDTPRSPCQRLLESEALSPGVSGTDPAIGTLQSGSVTTQCQHGHPRVAGGRRRSGPFFGKGTGGLKLLFSN